MADGHVEPDRRCGSVYINTAPVNCLLIYEISLQQGLPVNTNRFVPRRSRLGMDWRLIPEQRLGGPEAMAFDEVADAIKAE